MDRSQAQKLVENIDVIKAFAEGKAVQYRRTPDSSWKDVCNPSFGLGAENYRIKPKLAEGWVVVYQNGAMGYVHGTETKAEVIATYGPGTRVVFMREVERS